VLKEGKLDTEDIVGVYSPHPKGIYFHGFPVLVRENEKKPRRLMIMHWNGKYAVVSPNWRGDKVKINSLEIGYEDALKDGDNRRGLQEDKHQWEDCNMLLLKNAEVWKALEVQKEE